MTSEIIPDGNAIRELPDRAILRFIRGLSIPVHVALAMCLLVIAIIIAAPLFAPKNPLAIDLALRLAPPSSQHWFGNDEQGRDILSRIIYGTRNTMVAVLASLAVGGSFGIFIGLIAAYYRRAEILIMRLIDLMLSFPAILICLVVVTFTGPGYFGLILALSISSTPIIARFVRSAAATVMTQDYILAARAAGLPDHLILLRYVLLNAWPQVVIMLTLRLGSLILIATALGFLGLGVQPPHPELGAMAAQSRQFLFLSPHVPLIPCLVIMVIVLSVNVLGDALRDFIDPRLQG